MTGASTPSSAALSSVGPTLWSRLGSDARTVVPWAVMLGIVLIAQAALVMADPAPGVTWSNAPFTDEAWNVVNARNLVLLGAWSTDDWTHHLITLPFSVLEAIAFAIGGVGIVQARLVSVLAVALTTGVLAWTLRRVLGSAPAFLGAVAFAGSALVLYYGRLAFLEPVETLFLVAAIAAIPYAPGEHARRAGLIAGLFFALSIGTKTNAVFPIVGILAAMAMVQFRCDAVRRWLVAAAAVIVVAGVAWLVVVWLPNRDSIGLMTDEWVRWVTSPPYNPVDRIARYLGSSDGTISYLAPLWIGSTIGVAATARAWHLLPLEARLLTSAGLGWVALGWGILFVVTYNPNRYLVPIVPGFALLISVGAYSVTRLLHRQPKFARALIAIAGLVLVFPGALSAVAWARSSTVTLPALQARVQAIIPAGSVVQGDYAPALAMRVPGVVLVTSFGANPGDLFAERNVRWLVLEPGERPAWVQRHPSVWAARERVLTAPWGTTTLELYRLPEP